MNEQEKELLEAVQSLDNVEVRAVIVFGVALKQTGSEQKAHRDANAFLTANGHPAVKMEVRT